MALAGGGVGLAALATLAAIALLAGHARERWLWGAQVATPFVTTARGDLRVGRSVARSAGRPPSVVPFNLPFENCGHPTGCGYYRFPARELSAVRAYGAVPMLNWSSLSIPLSVREPALALRNVAGGAFDSYLRTFAHAAARWGHPFLLRFNWEMNGTWFPWEAGANGNDAAEFVAAWRHVHDIFVAQGARNVSWVWCPNVDFEHTLTPLRELYPGDRYVDWTCLDGYNFGDLHGPGGWMTFNQIFASTYRQVVAIAPSKPMIIGETASSETGGSKAAWIANLFTELPRYAKIHGLVYFDKYDGRSDWPFTTSRSAQRAFRAGIADPAFATNTYATQSAVPIPPP